MNKKLSNIEIALVFLLSLLFVVLLLILYAHAFAGVWHHIEFQNEMPNALILSAVLTSLIVVVRHISGRAGMYLAAGLALIALEILFELPLKKYVSLNPSTHGIRDWFFLFGVAEFIGMSIVLLGFTFFLHTREKQT